MINFDDLDNLPFNTGNTPGMTFREVILWAAKTCPEVLADTMEKIRNTAEMEGHTLDAVTTPIKKTGGNMKIIADVDPEDVLDDMSTVDILKYLNLKENRNFGKIEHKDEDEITCNETLVNAFFHGDFDLKGLLRAIGKDPVNKVLKELFEETPVSV